MPQQPRCPVCSLPLDLVDRSWGCESGHRFDQAREGYVNLHLAQHKRSREPGDNRDMVEARRRFLAGGHYDPLIRAIGEAVDSQRPAPSVLDAGCGEGGYLRRLMDMGFKLGGRMGIDVSKPAVRLAAKADPEGFYAVASSFALPVMDESVDVVLRVFAPGDAADAWRVLRPGGLYLIATPGPRHLFELKERIYQAPREHEPFNSAFDGFEPPNVQSVTFKLVLDDGRSVSDLLAMTPYFWSARPELQSALKETESMRLTADFRLHVLRKPA